MLVCLSAGRGVELTDSQAAAILVNLFYISYEATVEAVSVNSVLINKQLLSQSPPNPNLSITKCALVFLFFLAFVWNDTVGGPAKQKQKSVSVVRSRLTSNISTFHPVMSYIFLLVVTCGGKK